ncbi:MAG: nucleotide sugar dehydrogenase [Candidatus Bathyarchaeum tardum]|nr:MAG: nucleotide sugar dehydrogenase [Candidatus Bathyarchaeum tardum]
MSSIMKLSSSDLESPQTRQNYTACIVGCGRTGLVTAGLFVEAGFNVIGVDSSRHIVHQLKKGVSPFTETDMRKFIEPQLKNSRFRATTNLRKAVTVSNIIVVGVSASLDSKKKPDYSRLEQACKDIGMSLTSGSLVMFQNIMGPGMTQTVAKEILENASGLKAGEQFGLAYFSSLNNSSNPSDNVHNGTKIVGGITKRSLKISCLVLETITKSHVVRVRDIKIAEAVRLLEEAYKDVNIAFANEFAKFCEKAGIDFVKIRDLINPLNFSGMAGLHTPRDSYLLVGEAEALDVKLRLLSLSAKINDETLDHAIRLIRDALRETKKNLRRSKIAVFGVSALPNRKKVAHSATKQLVKRLKQVGVSVQVYDPFFSHKELTSMNYDAQKTMSQTVEGADCIVIAVAHEKFSRLNLKRLHLLMKQPTAIVDMGQVIDPIKAENAGFVYRGFGRGIWTK